MFINTHMLLGEQIIGDYVKRVSFPHNRYADSK